MRKKWIGVVLAAVLMAGVAHGGLLSPEPGELTTSGLFWLVGHGDDELFQTGFGLGASYREWVAFPFGVGLNLNVAQWQVDKNSNAIKWDGVTRYSGDATLLGLGPAVYFCIIDWDTWNLTLEGGIQFVHVDSSVRVQVEDERLNLRIGSAIIWHVGLEYDYMLSESMYLQAAGGYQGDLSAANTKYKYGSVRDTSLQGVFLRLGVKFLF